MNCTIRSVALTLAALVPLSACAPRYQPREVLVPDTCEPLLRRVGEQGTDALDERELRHLAFCQQQRLLRAEEEQAAYVRYQVRNAQSTYVLSLVYSALALVVLLLDQDR